MTLAGKEVRVVALNTRATPGVHVTGPSLPEDGQLVVSGGRILFQATASGEQTFQMSNGRKVTVEARVPSLEPPLGAPSSRPSSIDQWSPWSLTVKTVTPTGEKTVAVPGALGDSQFQQMRLKDWRSITQVHGESGVGTYTSTTTLPDSWNANHSGGMWLQLGAVDGTADISVNNQSVGTQIDSGQRWDITPYLHAGVNTVQIAVRTTLRNAVTTYNAKSTVTQPYGLRGPVTLVPYGAVAVSGKRS
jgi:hypothetical protein